MAKKENKKKIRLEVRVSNKRAISIYEKFGFEKNGIIKGYYGNEDGIEFVYRLKGKL
jgi:ribosomal protein S18 acetylase RimI-like enzyme